MNPLEQKIKELLGYDHIDSQLITKKMKLIVRHVFNELYPREATGEVEPWATKEQQEGQETWASGFNQARKQMCDKAELLGIIE